MKTLILVLSLVLAVDASAFERDKRGRIRRNGWAVTEFKRMTGIRRGGPGTGRGRQTVQHAVAHDPRAQGEDPAGVY